MHLHHLGSSTPSSFPRRNAAIAPSHRASASLSFGFGGCLCPTRLGLIRGTGNFPRRSKMFFLRLYQQTQDGQRVRVADVPVRNHGYQDYPRWKPQGLPIEHQTNNFTFALVTAKVGIASPGSLLPPYALQAGEWIEFRFQVSAQGRPASGWSINEMIMWDATGNRLRVSGEDLGALTRQLSRLEQNELVCVHRWGFWADEPAWRLSVHFEQRGDWDCWIDYMVRPEFLHPDISRRGGTAR